MKKLSIIAILTIIISCTKTETPTPETAKISVPTNPNPISTTYNFHGHWSCYNWQKTPTVTHRYQFLFTTDSISTRASLNDYSSLTSYDQLFTYQIAFVDSNFFNIPYTNLGIKFKGVMINDSTLTVYQYEIDLSTGVVDTFQVKNFIRE